MTHYPRSLEEARQITSEEADVSHSPAKVPDLVADLIEEITFQARESEYVDQTSGVSARVSISAYENLVSAIEQRALRNGDNDYFPRLCDVYSVLPALTGKIELVYEGEQEGPALVAQALVGKAINTVFGRHFPPPKKGRQNPDEAPVANPYEAVVDFFSSGRKLELSDDMTLDDYRAHLMSVAGLKEIVKKHFNTKDEREILLRMELVLDGLHHNNVIAREEEDAVFRYSDILSDMLQGMGGRS